MDIDDETRKHALLLHYIGSSAFDAYPSILRRNATLMMKPTSFVKLVNVTTN
jgi:hypothetical protein